MKAEELVGKDVRLEREEMSKDETKNYLEYVNVSHRL